MAKAATKGTAAAIVGLDMAGNIVDFLEQTSFEDMPENDIANALLEIKAHRLRAQILKKVLEQIEVYLEAQQ